MSKFLISTVGMFLLTAMLGCGATTSWWSNAQSDPFAQVHSILVQAEIAKGVATATFEAIKLQLPPSEQVGAETVFQKAMLLLGGAEAAVQDALNAAVAAQEPHPDLSAVFLDLSAAVSAVQQVIETYRSTTAKAVAGAASAADSEEFQREVTRIKNRLSRGID